MTIIRTLVALVAISISVSASAQTASADQRRPVWASNVIAGKITSKGFPGPLGSNSWFQTRITIFRTEPGNTYLQYVNATDCWDTGQGCVDSNNSRYRFDAGYLGEGYGLLQPGTYTVIVNATGHKGSTRATKVITLPTNEELNFQLEVVGAYGEVMEQAQNISSSGGKLWAVVRLHNFGSETGQALVKTVYSGRGLTTEYVTYDDTKNIVSLSEEGSYQDIFVMVSVEGELPDGVSYCANVKVTHPTREKEEYSSEWFCAFKGTN